VIVLLDDGAAERRLRAGGLRCDCGGRLRPWGHARVRSVRCLDGRLDRQRPRRGRCVGCGRSHVLVPSGWLPRRTHTVETVGVALLAAAAGQGHRTIARSVQLPDDTVRGWLRRATRGAEWLRAVAVKFAHRADPQFVPPPPPRGRALADAVEALGLAAAAAVRRLGLAGRSPWRIIATITCGRLLARQRGS
jgi:hypothetical protein